MVHLQADPPADLSWSGGDFADEGFWSHNARNEVLFGEPVQNEWDARIVSPLFARLQTLIFHLFGAGLIQVRLIGLLSSVLVTVCCFLILLREFESRIAFSIAALVSLNYPMLVLGRQGLLEPFAAALLCISLALLFTQYAPVVFLSGVFLAASCFTKFLMVYTLLPIALIIFVWLKPSKRSVILFVIGATLTTAVWLFANYLPHRELLEGYNRYYASQQKWQPGAIAMNLMTQPFYLYFSKTPAVLFFANLMLWRLFRSKTSGVIERLFWLWLLIGILFFAFWGYRPLRYYSS
ncbi:MAG TPA: hypothetical protein VJ521_09440, partial [Acidobacteriota bacterium]|nr:hypothetical protein [Acidobacteriota bacterium]